MSLRPDMTTAEYAAAAAATITDPELWAALVGLWARRDQLVEAELSAIRTAVVGDER